MGYQLVAHTAAQGNANGVTTAAINTTGATLLALWLASNEGAPPPTVTDSFGNVWTQLQIHFGTTSRGTWYFCDNPTVGANHTFGVNGANSFPAVGVSAWSGPLVSVADAAAGTGSGAAVLSAQPGSVTPTVAGDLCLFGLTCAQIGAPANLSVDSGFTVLDSAVNVASTALGMAHAYLVQSVAGAINPKFSWTNGSDEACAIVCIKALSSGGGGTGTPPPAPTLAVVDKGDGTGATATISGGDAGAVNTVLVAPQPGALGNVAFAAGATINGNASGALALAPGYYIAKAYATENSLTSLDSNEVYFKTTGPAAGVVPSGPIALPKSQVRDMVAASATFQAKTGLLSQAAAYARAFRTFVRREDDEHRSLRPYATILTTPELQYLLDSGGDKNYLLPQGAVGVLLTDNDRYPEDINDSSIDFENFVGGVLADLEAQAGLPGGLGVIRLELLAIRRLPEETERAQGIWWEALLAVHWQA